MLFATDGAAEARVAHHAVDPAVEAPGEVARSGVGVACAPAPEQHLPLVGPAVAVGVLEREDMRRLGHDQAAVVGQHARGDRELLGVHVAAVGLAVAVGVDELHDPVAALALARLD